MTKMKSIKSSQTYPPIPPPPPSQPAKRSSKALTNVRASLGRFFETPSSEFTVKIAEKPEEIKALLEAGFDYVCQKDSLVFLRKRN